MQSIAIGASRSVGSRGLRLSGSPVDDAAAWMQNRLDGTHHPALNTDNPYIFYNDQNARFHLLADRARPDL